MMLAKALYTKSVCTEMGRKRWAHLEQGSFTKKPGIPREQSTEDHGTIEGESQW